MWRLYNMELQLYLLSTGNLLQTQYDDIGKLKVKGWMNHINSDQIGKWVEILISDQVETK